jgi:hypothetical protein
MEARVIKKVINNQKIIENQVPTARKVRMSK